MRAHRLRAETFPVRWEYSLTSPSEKRETRPSLSHRAWAEISLDHLRHNAAELQRLLPSGCRLMAVVKANAYGHGMTEIAGYLNRSGMDSFAVAEIGEGILLREQGIQGEILILGYTDPERAADLARYHLTQTMVSLEYGQALEALGIDLEVHVKIDTGMNRLGVPHQDTESILRCYDFVNLRVTGIFSHLSMSDGLGPEETEFTRRQIAHFDGVVAQIKKTGIDPGLVHLQSSYGMLNYPELRYDRARPGIALYGLLSQEGDAVRCQAELRPVLALKATVTQVKEVQAGQSVGYGRRFVPEHDIRIATVSIGYADGVPRILSDGGGQVLIRGQRATIIGSICMDQLTVDVTGIDGVMLGDTVTLIGQDGDEQITAGEIAARCRTVTNEIVSRIGSRVQRIYVQ